MFNPTPPHGKELRAWREAHHLSRMELAAMVGCDVSTIHRLEHAIAKPNGMTRRALARVIESIEKQANNGGTDTTPTP